MDGTVYRFIDTAGIRRRVKEASGHEYYASLRTHGAIERAEDLERHVPNCDLRMLPENSHWLLLEDPALIVDHALPFLASLGADAEADILEQVLDLDAIWAIDHPEQPGSCPDSQTERCG